MRRRMGQGARARCAALAVAVLAAGAVPAQASDCVDEGDDMVFTVELGAAPNGWSVRYSYGTKEDTATEGEDYKKKTGKVVFDSGEDDKTVSVTTYTDTVDEDEESVQLVLDNRETNGLLVTYVNGQRQLVQGWVATELEIYGIPKTMTLTRCIAAD